MSTTDPNAPEIILITGINGYIASHIGLILLSRGYTVRGTSRSSSAEKQLRSGAYKDYQSQYQHALVPDITAPAAFDEAVKGVHGIIHTASPVDFTLTSLDAFFGPAIGGNLSLLNSTLQAGEQLKAFVVTSSIAAIIDGWKNPPDYTYTEADWNTSGEAVARSDFTAPVAYGASKAAAERALWDWREQHHPKFSVSVVNPAVVTGPPVNWPETPEKLNETLLPVWQIFSGEAKELPGQIGPAIYVDVRDVASLHVWCLEHPEEADGGRYLAANGKGNPQAMADMLRREYPDKEIVVGTPGSGYVQGSYWYPEGELSLVSKKAYTALGVERFMGFEQSILDTVRAFEERWPERLRNSKR